MIPASNIFHKNRKQRAGDPPQSPGYRVVVRCMREDRAELRSYTMTDGSVRWRLEHRYWIRIVDSAVADKVIKHDRIDGRKIPALRAWKWWWV